MDEEKEKWLVRYIRDIESHLNYASMALCLLAFFEGIRFLHWLWH